MIPPALAAALWRFRGPLFGLITGAIVLLAGAWWHHGQVSGHDDKLRRDIDAGWQVKIAAAAAARAIEKRQAEDAIAAIERDRLQDERDFAAIKEKAANDLADARRRHPDFDAIDVPDDVVRALNAIGSTRRKN